MFIYILKKSSNLTHTKDISFQSVNFKKLLFLDVYLH